MDYFVSKGGAVSFRSQKLLESAKDKPCLCCFTNDGTTVPAHVNSVALGKGVGEKAPDSIHARLCQDCHDKYDGRKPGWSPEERLERFFYAYARTVKAWFEEGLIQVKGK